MSFFDFFGGGMPHGHEEEEEDNEPIDNEKFYKILGVSKDASDSDIKKAYKQKAKELHPDRHPNELEKYQALFQELQQANEVLSDPQKRNLYDKYGEQGVRRGGGGGGGGMEDLLSQMFGGSAKRGPAGPKKSPPIKHTLDVTLEDLYKGSTKKVTVEKYSASSDQSACVKCNGEGVITVVQRMGPMMLQQRRECDQCNGIGYKLSSKKVEIDIHIPVAARHGETITLSAQGNEYPDHQAGDILVLLKCAKHPVFTRQGADLGMNYILSLKEALCGYEIKIKHVSGRILSIKSQEGEIVQHGQLKRVYSWGMPQRYSTNIKGHLYIKMEVKLPPSNSLKPEVLEQFSKYLPDIDSKENEEYTHRRKLDAYSKVPPSPKSSQSSPRKNSNNNNNNKNNKKSKNNKRKNSNSKSSSKQQMDIDEEEDDEEEGYIEEVSCDNVDGNPKATPAASKSVYEEDEEEQGVSCKQM